MSNSNLHKLSQALIYGGAALFLYEGVIGLNQIYNHEGYPDNSTQLLTALGASLCLAGYEFLKASSGTSARPASVPAASVSTPSSRSPTAFADAATSSRESSTVVVPRNH